MCVLVNDQHLEISERDKDSAQHHETRKKRRVTGKLLGRSLTVKRRLFSVSVIIKRKHGPLKRRFCFSITRKTVGLLFFS